MKLINIFDDKALQIVYKWSVTICAQPLASRDWTPFGLKMHNISLSMQTFQYLSYIWVSLKAHLHNGALPNKYNSSPRVNIVAMT